MYQETLAKIQCGILGFYRHSCVPISHTEQQFAWQGVTRDEFKEKELVAVSVTLCYF